MDDAKGETGGTGPPEAAVADESFLVTEVQ